MTLIKRIRCAFFRRKLAADVAKRKAAFETQDYVKRRAAALKGRAMRSDDRRSGVPSGTEPVSRLGLTAPAAIAGDA